VDFPWEAIISVTKIMNKTQSAKEPSSNPKLTSGHLVQGFRAKYYDIGNLPLGLPLVTLPHIRLTSLQPGQSLLDIGCGTGEVLYRALKKFGGAVFLYGIDPSNDMLEVARYKLRKASNVILERGAGENLRFPDASFDWVVSSLTFHHLPLDLKRLTLREIYRVLKPGGALLISDFGKPTHFTGRLLSNIWVNHAFTSENFRGILPELILEQGFVDLSDSVTGGGIHHTRVSKPG
jgi:ubiquinone/menaquinone biosynthesis C-methylase UbiE